MSDGTGGISSLWTVLVGLFSGLIGATGLAYTIRRGDRAEQDKKLAAVADRLGEVEAKMEAASASRGEILTRIAVIEQRLAQVPTTETVHRLEIAITDMKAQIVGLHSAVDKANELLLRLLGQPD